MSDKTLPHVHEILDLLCPVPMAYQNTEALDAGTRFHEQMATWLKGWRQHGDPPTLHAGTQPAVLKAVSWLRDTIRAPLWVEDVLTAPDGYLATPDLIGLARRGTRLVLVDWKHTAQEQIRYYVQIEAYAALPEVGADADRYLVFVTDTALRAVKCPKNPIHRVAFICALRIWQWRQLYG